MLAEIAPAARSSFALPPPIPPSRVRPLAQPALYAPLAFTVGREVDRAFTTGQFAGNLLSSVRSGRQYAARRVVRATRARHGVRLVATSTDPAGRRLVVLLRAGRGAAIRVSVRVTGRGVAAVSDSFASVRGEAFHGFGGRHNALDQHGNAFYSWTEEENQDGGGFTTHDLAARGLQPPTLYPNGPTAAYYPQAQFISSRPNGLLLDRPELVRWRLDSDRPDAWQADVAARRLDYVVAPGRGPAAIRTLTAITGRQRVPPAWGLGPMLDRETQLAERAGLYEAQVRQDLRDIDRYHLPLRAYRLEGWRILSPATVRELIAALHRRGIRAMVYFRAFVADDIAATEPLSVYRYALAHRLVARTRAGAPFMFVDSFGGRAALIDFTNPRAVRWWQRRVRAALDLGADGFMQDFGEEVLPGMVFHDGEGAATMHNRFPVLFHRASRAVLDAYGHSHRRRSFFFFTRAGYSGRPGSAAYENANFPGDETTDWTHTSGLRSLVADMLNRAVGGAYGYSTDIGGYLDLLTPPPSKELFLRWAELAALTPIFRLHGSLIHGTNTPWRFDAQTVSAYDALSRLHLRAAPLILRLWHEARRSGMPVTRPLWLAYPHDHRAARQDQEWLLGPDVLVAPVVAQGARARSVYFPRGCWRAGTGGRRYAGGRAATVRAGLTTLPWFTRCGSRPLGPERPRSTIRGAR